MIVRSICNTCFQPFKILFQASDTHLLKLASEDGQTEGLTCRCPRLCGGRINLIGDPSIDELRKGVQLAPELTITGVELYQAIHGMGLKDEIPKNKETVDALLRANKVESLDIEELDGRIYIHGIKLDNGLTLHLAAGLHGAHVLKVTKTRKSDGQ